MSDRIFTLFFSLSLTLQNVCTGFQVWTFFQYNFEHNNSVNIICQHNVSEAWNMGATVLINDKSMCTTEPSNAACHGEEEGNKFKFTLNITDESKQFLYRCMVYKKKPLPIQTRIGEGIRFLPGCAIPPPTPKDLMEVGNDCPQVSVLFWALFAVLSMLGLYSLIITVLYIIQMRKFSKELSVTYVSMQGVCSNSDLYQKAAEFLKRIAQRRKVKGHGTDKNEEYMDMRKVHHHTQPIRDMNHNSRPNPDAFRV